ncbi:unnamed protein product [Ostreobium quekettii]|uniref:Uncharacterized protein n=1 Tax=Ostreobium quekettii TaxID=121088 RepID=A0A8S1IVS0_9CHLO|nr:unnamed protein product [Ostreobium quekettii]
MCRYGPVAKWICLIGSIIGVILGLWRFFQDRITTKADVARQLTEAENSKAYEMALARARQAIFVEKAVGFMNIGSPARAMVELDRALKANAICRSPLLNSRYSKYEFENLYRLYIRNTDVPPDFAHLLQLREMLDIEDSDAEEIETLVMERPPPVGL